ncbi:methionyl aminopeptidase [Methanococcus maripaludis]|uniref:Methionine aminopeptidase n=1 Tax=Methanococcus maripaludis TaxID=39152 RepID=A0A7J9NXB7_METMI|nr:type II methionyl aminopeptidase [Methanococcus maripaludis]MBA2852349.1 methionyl aminopeptidase [Methanococcus maripaludis]
MNDEEYNKIIEAGKIASQVKEEAVKLVKPGAKLYDVAEFVENRTRELGAGIGFPCNISLNDIAAHYSPSYGDESIFSDEDIVKLDLGAHIDGFIADTAVTIDLSGKYSDLKKASEDALNTVIKEIMPEMNVGEMGKIIQEVIESYGYRPVSNLSGHVMHQYSLHSGVSIPNVSENTRDTIDVGDLVAIEPFATDGFGQVVDGKDVYIFKYLRSRPTRLPAARNLLRDIEQNHAYLPFSERDMAKIDKHYKTGLKGLMMAGVLYGYPTLVEREHGIVSQCEHTVLVTENGVEITTK